MEVLLNMFDGTASGNLLSNGSCGVSPIATANNHILHQLASMDKRYCGMNLCNIIIMSLFLYSYHLELCAELS